MDIQGPHNLTLPVHEVITAASLAEVGLLKPEDFYYADYQFIHGVLWNDDPGGHFHYCDGRINRHLVSGIIWVAKFKLYGFSTQFKADLYCHPDAPLMSRSHYGDMQFLHSMKPYGCDNQQTLEYILAWAEFCYRLATRHINENTPLSEIDIPFIAKLFPADSRHGRNPVYDLFKAGKCPTEVNKRAMGSLLHMIQDSYSSLHVKREKNSEGRKGIIVDFYDLLSQSHKDHIHTEAEAFPQKFSANQHPAKCHGELIKKIDGGIEAKTVGVELLKFMLSNESWLPKVKAYLVDEVFHLVNI